eukprot:CAMPEP_0178952886 /NCGR_PEP_ID=MMETSP0789-20121207/8104_1 /TAXON_ID=3005 /ORGANISM="Rhizosolenia setigera, Strain CCMP 1694" /LENGTH=317 /DNA_ID=CAMNT_0020634067 /DNA_START=235 /DNA_END=1188 /DNA_ORIENTATION=+
MSSESNDQVIEREETSEGKEEMEEVDRFRMLDALEMDFMDEISDLEEDKIKKLHMKFQMKASPRKKKKKKVYANELYTVSKTSENSNSTSSTQSSSSSKPKANKRTQENQESSQSSKKSKTATSASSNDLNTKTSPNEYCGFSDLNDDTLHEILEFTGKKSYRVFGLLNKRCNKIFPMYGLPKETFIYGFGSLEVCKNQYGNHHLAKGIVWFNRTDLLDLTIRDQYDYRVESVCFYAIREGRLDILKDIFQRSNEKTLKYLRKDSYLCNVAARRGRLVALKFLRTQGCNWDSDVYRAAKRKGHVHVLQYLHQNGCHE